MIKISIELAPGPNMFSKASVKSLILNGISFFWSLWVFSRCEYNIFADFFPRIAKASSMESSSMLQKDLSLPTVIKTEYAGCSIVKNFCLIKRSL